MELQFSVAVKCWSLWLSAYWYLFSWLQNSLGQKNCPLEKAFMKEKNLEKHRFHHLCEWAKTKRKKINHCPDILYGDLEWGPIRLLPIAKYNSEMPYCWVMLLAILHIAIWWSKILQCAITTQKSPEREEV